MKAAGISAHQIIAPLILAATLFAAAHFIFSERIVIRANAALSAWESAEWGPVPEGSGVQDNVAVSHRDDLIFVQSVSGQGDAVQLRGLAIYERDAGTLRRIAAFAKPYTGAIVAFLVLVVVDALLVVATPLLFKKIIDDGVVKGDAALVTWLSLLVALIAFFEAGLTLTQRYFSSRIGEGLIYDLRTKVFGHVQRMPLAFFTRTRTGALVSRLNNDVIGAQSAITSTLSHVGPARQLIRAGC